MSTVGKVCLSITLLLLLLTMAPFVPGIYGGWAPKLLVLHNEWSTQLRDSRLSVQKAAVAHSEGMQELRKASTDLDVLMTGWDGQWTIPARDANLPDDAPRIDKRNGQLLLDNIGTGSDPPLVTRQVEDDQGNQQLMSPVVHAFYSAGEGYVYAGEFVAVEITESEAVLQPVHGVMAEEADAWPVNAVWRLRAMIPTAERTTVDELHRHEVRAHVLITQADANIDRQRRLLEAAEDSLETRRGELLGDPDREPVPGHPEFVDGLLKATEDIEEERNQLMLDIDALRRAVDVASDERSQRLLRLNQMIEQLPQTGQDVPQVSRRLLITQ